jgi:hypothetical protein
MDLKDHKDAVPDSRLANAKTLDSRDAQRCNRQDSFSVIRYRSARSPPNKKPDRSMKRTKLALMAAWATALFGFVMVRRKLTERACAHGMIKETFWTKLRELWAIRRRCREIKLQQQKNRPLRSNKGSVSFLRRNSSQTTNLSR